LPFDTAKGLLLQSLPEELSGIGLDAKTALELVLGMVVQTLLEVEVLEAPSLGS